MPRASLLAVKFTQELRKLQGLSTFFWNETRVFRAASDRREWAIRA
jgi:hypothetical protein